MDAGADSTMAGFLELAAQNILSPVVLFFVLGVAAALARSDLSIPEAIAKTLALYLMMSIGFKGGVEVAKTGLTAQMLKTGAAGIVLSFLIPVLGFHLLRLVSRLPAVDAAAVAAHYGSISIVTFVAATEALRGQGFTFEGHLVAVAAIMETPAILSALVLARRYAPSAADAREPIGPLLREIGLNGSVVMLLGSFAIGWITGPKGLEPVAPFLVDLFRGVLCLFLLDMGLVAGRGMRAGWKDLSAATLGFAIAMPVVSALLAAALVPLTGLSAGGAAIFVTLAASASYIAVPAAMRIALPEARPSIYLTLSLGITFPFNLAFGIPLYQALAAFTVR